MHPISRFGLAALALTAAPLLAQQLPTDPALVTGQLENGVHYIIRHHANPEGRFHAWLHVKAGALNETDAQNGGAHFLEHLAFNGSEHYPPGDLIPRLNELGMQFGADSNAHTSLHETVFKLNLPGNDQAMIDRALTILGDFAHGLTLAPTEVDQERGVILEEKRSGLGPQERIGEQVRKWLFAGSRLEVHDVIGTEASIEAMKPEQLTDLWNTWYRPELVTLIVVGDVDPKAVLEAAKKTLGGWKARADAREFEGTGAKPTTEPRALVVADPEVVQGQIQMVALSKGREPARTAEEYHERLVERLALQVLSTRLHDMVQKGDAPWMFAAAHSDSFVDMRESAAFAVGRPDQWKPMVTGLVTELKRALDHGFNANEIQRAVEEMIAGAERAVETESSCDANVHVRAIARAVERGSVLMSAAQRLELVKALDGIEPDAVSKAFRSVMDTRGYQYVLEMPKADGNPTSADVLAAEAAAWKAKTEAVEASAEKLSILEKLPEPGVETARSSDAETGVTTVEFENGAVMHFRHMDKPASSVAVAITIPGGALEETADNRGVTEVASLANATSRLTSLQIRDTMAGKKVRVDLGAGRDTVTVAVQGAPDDLEDGMQLANALLRDARVEQSAFDNWKEQKLQAIEEAKTDLMAQFSDAVRKAHIGDDVRFRNLTAKDVEARSVEEADQWLRHLIDGEPMEVAVVGDLPLDRAVALVARYVGSLPKAKHGFDVLDPLRKVALPEGAQKVSVTVPTVTEKAMVLAGFRGCDDREITERRALNLCAKILSDRMRVRVREDERLVYSIQCMSHPGVDVPGTGLVFAAAPTDPKTADRLADELITMMKEFAEKGPTDEELKVARKQANEALAQALDQPGFWLGSLADLRYRDRDLDEFHGLKGLYDSFTKEQVQQAARRFFVEGRELRVVAVPKEKS